MKKSLHYVYVVIAALALMAFVGAFVPPPVASQTNASQVPADVKQILKEAVRIEQADPPIDLVFLFEVKSSKEFREYLETYRVPVIIELGDVFIQYNYGDQDIFFGTHDEKCTDMAECRNDGPFLKGAYGTERERKCSQEIIALLRGHRESEFWPLLKAEVQKYIPSGHKK